MTGELCFASSNNLTTLFEYTDDPAAVVIDLSRARVWDASTVAALDAITEKYAQRDKTVTIVGMDDDTSTFHGRLSGGFGPGG